MGTAASAVIVAVLAGHPAIMEADLADYQASQACYGEGALTSRQAALMRLLEAALAETAMTKAGAAPIDEADLKKDAERIDKETQAPEILACIKAHFGSDTARYRRIFVRSHLAEARLRKFLMSDAAVQGKVRLQARQAAKLARSGATLAGAAEAFGLTYTSATYYVEPSTGLPGRGEFQAGFIREQLAGLTTGQLTPEPVESDYDLKIIRLLSVDGPRWTFESAYIRKRSQEEWFASLPKRRLEVRDKVLHSWLSSIRGNPRLSAVELK